MKQTFTEQFVAASGNEAMLAKRIVKTLESNGITSMDILLSKEPREIQSIKGIGDRALHILGQVMTKERMKREKKMDIYRKTQGKAEPQTLCGWLEKAGVCYTEARQLEKILKTNGIRDICVFMNTPEEKIASFERIGVKRLENLRKVKALLLKKKRVKK